MNRLQQASVWLRRIGHCQGFGIQSPSDYRFVRYVVNEHWPYYAYAELGKDDDWLRQKLGRLYFRLANFLQPALISDMLGYQDYLKAGCHKATIQTQYSNNANLTLAPGDTNASELQPDNDNGCQVLVIQDIWNHPTIWKKILADSRATITYDLYYCGIAFFNPERNKQHYIVNF
ncbi:MAG: hypothetical protein K5683_00835 [Prevotella sp.]|nr:hypothetical protein [Prevotella sp.]